MIEIAPLVNTRPLKKIKKVVPEEQKKADKQPSQEQTENENEAPSTEDSESQHIDEIV